MKIFNILILLFLVSCDSHYDWYIHKYIAANVENQSSAEVKIAFCSVNPAYVSKVEVVQPNQKILSKTLVETYVDDSIDHPQNYIPQQYLANVFAALSSNDTQFNKLCINDETYQNQTNYSSTKTYLIIDNLDNCPVGFKNFDQQQNPCQVNF